MKDARWSRPEAIASLRADVWRYLTQTARTDEELALEASRLLQMPAADVLTLARLHFVLSDEVGELLAQMPALIRRLATTTVPEREQSAERVRGYIEWSRTFSARAAARLPNLYVTAPSRRAFQTPENQLLVFVLDAIAHFGRVTGWERSTGSGAGEAVRSRVTQATRWRRVRALADLPVQAPAATVVARVRASRRRRTYSAVLAALGVHRELIARLNRQAIRSAVENHALVTRDDAVLLELLSLFRAMAALVDLGWRGREAQLVRSGLVFSAERDGHTLDLYYQHTPAGLARASRYGAIQRAHDFSAVGRLRPDLVAEVTAPSGESRWVLIEVKGVDGPAAGSARAAILDLLAYRRAFDPALAGQAGVYGIGVAWGEAIRPGLSSEVLVCSPDTLSDALAHALP